MSSMDKKSIAALIDHTLLKPETTKGQIRQCCREALEYHFASVCVNPCFVKLVSQELAGSGVKTCSVVGFPLGAHTREMKTLEAGKAVEDGAQEVDMVINIGALKAGDSAYVEKEISQVVKAAQGSLVKVIIETCLLTDGEKSLACMLAKQAGAHFVKTSTGFSIGGATPYDVAFMRKVVGKTIGVKASGGIRTLAGLLAMVEAGANRIGASAGVAIMEEISPGD